MKQSITISCAVLLCFFSLTASAQNDQDAMMKAWAEYSTPGTMHQQLAKDDGEWTTEISLWMQPGQEPVKSEGSCVNKMILGGRYQESRHTGTFMGQPMEGISTLAYDNARKKFISSWIDNMGTGIMYMEGDWDEATQTVVFTGKQVDPMTGKDIDVREVFKRIDDNNQMLEMYMIQDGKEMKTMEIKFKRKV